MPSDADSLTEPEVEDRSEELAAPAEGVDALDDRDGGHRAGDARLDDLDDDDDVDVLAGAPPRRPDPYPDGRRQIDTVDEALLFEGDPDDYEMDFGLPVAEEAMEPVAYLDEAPVEQYAPLPRMSRAERRRRVRLQARRVRRIVRHVEPWSVLKISLLFYACLWVIFLVAGFMIWGVAESSGTVGKLESLIRELFALETFSFDAGQIFRGYALGGLALAIAGTTFNVLLCLLFNLISDLTGGLRVTMIEEETARPVPPRRARRRPPQRRR